MFLVEKTIQVFVTYNGIVTKSIAIIAYISDVVFLSFKQKWRLLENHESHFTHKTVNTHCKASHMVMATEITRLAQKVVILCNLEAERCTASDAGF